MELLKMNQGTWGFALAAVVCLGCDKEPTLAPQLPEPAAPVTTHGLYLAQEPAPIGCTLTVPRNPKLGPLLFPTLDGATEFDNAISNRESTATLSAVVRANNAFEVPRLTKCSLVTTETRDHISYAKVRILDGALAGSVAWLPEIQTKGQ